MPASSQPPEPSDPLDLGAIIRETLASAREHALPQWGAALAFYAAVSLAPLLMILLSITAPLVGSTALQSAVEGYAHDLLGRGGEELVQTILFEIRDRAELPKGIALVALFGGALLFFVQLQTALNHIWNARPRRRHVWRFFRRRVKAMGLTALLGVLLTASMTVGSALGAVARFVQDSTGAQLRWFASLSWLGSIVFFALLVAVLYKTLPDVRLGWRDLGVGVLTTTLLFALGRWVSGLYFVRASVTSLYGAAASLIVLLFWLYYSAVSALLAAEFTAVWADAHGRPLRRKRSSPKRASRPGS